MFAWFNDLLRSLINLTYSITASHGWSVVLFTVLIKAILFPLDFKSRKSMNRMTSLQPKINALNQKYAKDKEKLNQKTAELYKKEKINPLAKLLPMLLTLPVLFAMFAVMRGVANEQRTRLVNDIYLAVGHLTDPAQVAGALSNFHLNLEPWLWIKNLWMADSPFTSILPLSHTDVAQLLPINGVDAAQIAVLKEFINTDIYKSVLNYYNAVPIAGGTINVFIAQLTLYATPNGFFVLPVLAAVTQFLTTMLTPTQAQAPVDPNKPNTTGNFMKYFMPVFSIWICATSTAAFSLYWVVSNVIALVQQVGLNWYFAKQAQKATVSTEEGLDK